MNSLRPDTALPNTAMPNVAALNVCGICQGGRKQKPQGGAWLWNDGTPVLWGDGSEIGVQETVVTNENLLQWLGQR